MPPTTQHHRRWWIFILVIALLVRVPPLLTVYQATVNDPTLFDSRLINNADSRDYVRLGENIIERGRYSAEASAPYTPELKRVPGYPVFLSVLYVLAGFQTSVALILLANGILSLLSIVLIKAIGERLFSERVGLIASAIYALAPATLAVMAQAMSETLFTTTLLGSVYYAIRVENNAPRQDLWMACLATVLLGVSVNIRAIAIAVFPLYGLLWAWRYSLGSALVRLMALTTLMYAACLAPWFIRNVQTFGYVTFSSVSDINLMLYNAASVQAHRQGISVRESKDRVNAAFGARLDALIATQSEPLSEKQLNQSRRAVAMEILLANPLDTAIYHAVDMIHMLRPGYSMMNLILEDDPTAYGNNVQTGSLPDPAALPLQQLLIFGYMTVYYSLLYLLTGMGALIILYRRQWVACLVVGVLPLWFAYVPSIAGNSRFRVPIEGFMALLSAVAIATLLHYLAGWRSEKITNSSDAPAAPDTTSA